MNVDVASFSGDDAKVSLQLSRFPCMAKVKTFGFLTCILNEEFYNAVDKSVRHSQAFALAHMFTLTSCSATTCAHVYEFRVTDFESRQYETNTFFNGRSFELSEGCLLSGAIEEIHIANACRHQKWLCGLWFNLVMRHAFYTPIFVRGWLLIDLYVGKASTEVYVKSKFSQINCLCAVMKWNSTCKVMHEAVRAEQGTRVM